MQNDTCCMCDRPGIYPHMGKMYCEDHIKAVTIRTLVFTRVVGYLRPVNFFNDAKKHEFYTRVNYDPAKAGVRDGKTEQADVSPIGGGGGGFSYSAES